MVLTSLTFFEQNDVDINLSSEGSLILKIIPVDREVFVVNLGILMNISLHIFSEITK